MAKSRTTTTKRVTTRTRNTTIPKRKTSTLEEHNVAAALDAIRKNAQVAIESERVLKAYIAQLEADMDEVRETAEQRLEELELDGEAQLEQLRSEIGDIQKRSEHEVSLLKRDHDAALSKGQSALSDAQRRHDKELASAEGQWETKVSEIKATYETQLKTTTNELERLRERLRVIETRLGSARDIITEPLRGEEI